MKRTAQIALLLVAVLVTLLTACSKRDKVVGIGDDDPEMAAAIAKAQETLPQFWQGFDQRAHGESNFVLVVRITDKGRIEHFHTTDFERRDGKTMVTISNAPKIVASVKLGDRIEIPAADITDWSYMRDGKYAGMFTAKPQFKHMPADQVEAFKKDMADPGANGLPRQIQWTAGFHCVSVSSVAGPPPVMCIVGPLERAMFASYQVRRWAAAAFVVCLLYLLYLLFVRPLLPHNVPGTVDLRLMGVSSSSNGVMLVSVVLTNSTPLALNVLGDADGQPAFILDDGSEQTWLTRMINKCSISLAPGGSLTNVVLVTNCPPQFRLKLAVDYLGHDSRDWPLPVGRLLRSE